MNIEMFNRLLDELDGNSLETLKTKNSRYGSTEDSLHNFKSGADIMGTTPAQCAWGYMTKHLVALRDKVQKDDFRDREDLLEKCQDIINYIRFIWIIGNDSYQKETKEAEKTHTCLNCNYRDDYSPACACFSCDDDYSEWAPITNAIEQEETEETEETLCSMCIYSNCDIHEDPCFSCRLGNLFCKSKTKED